MNSLTTSINREFLIRISGRESRLVSVSMLAYMFGQHFCEKWCRKALSSLLDYVSYTKNGYVITFVAR